MSTQTISTDRLRQDYIRQGDTLYTVTLHTSASGLTRDIKILAVVNGELVNITGFVADGLGYKINRANGGLRVRGAGMDMGYHVVHNLGIALYGDGYALRHRTI